MKEDRVGIKEAGAASGGGGVWGTAVHSLSCACWGGGV